MTKSKAQKAQDLDQLRQAQISRQVDTINRLLGHQHEENVPPPVYRYEHELMHLNEQLALADIRREMHETTLRRIRQSCRDQVMNSPRGTAIRVDQFIQWIEEVMPDEGPSHLATGRDTSDVQVLDLPTN